MTQPLTTTPAALSSALTTLKSAATPDSLAREGKVTGGSGPHPGNHESRFGHGLTGRAGLVAAVMALAAHPNALGGSALDAFSGAYGGLPTRRGRGRRQNMPSTTTRSKRKMIKASKRRNRR